MKNVIFVLIMVEIMFSCVSNDNNDGELVKRYEKDISCKDTFDINFRDYNDLLYTYQVLGDKSEKVYCDTLKSLITINDTLVGPIWFYENHSLVRAQLYNQINGKFNFQEAIVFNRSNTNEIDTSESLFFTCNADDFQKTLPVFDNEELWFDFSIYKERYSFLDSIEFNINFNGTIINSVFPFDRNLYNISLGNSKVKNINRLWIEIDIREEDLKDGLSLNRFYLIPK